MKSQTKKPDTWFIHKEQSNWCFGIFWHNCLTSMLILLLYTRLPLSLVSPLLYITAALETKNFHKWISKKHLSWPLIWYHLLYLPTIHSAVIGLFIAVLFLWFHEHNSVTPSMWNFLLSTVIEFNTRPNAQATKNCFIATENSQSTCPNG